MRHEARGTGTKVATLNLRALRSITSTDAPAAPPLPSYGATHLRTGLSRLPVLLTPKRVAGIIAPLLAAVFFWVTVPAFAGFIPGAANDPISVVPPASGQSSVSEAHPAAQAQSSHHDSAPQAAPSAAAPAVVAPAAAAGTSTTTTGTAAAATTATSLAAPVTGANDGILRIILVGLCLGISGAVLLTAPKRNPHAVLWG
jgi:hypothetical protein